MKMTSAMVLAATLAFSCANAANVICTDSSHIDSDGTLVIDSSASKSEFGWRRYALTAEDFVPGERYRVTFKARVEACASKAHLYVLVRPKGFGGSEKDLATLSVKPTDGKWKDCEMKFEVSGEEDYRLQFHGWNKFKAEITDLKIVKRPPFTFVPAVRGGSTTNYQLPSTNYHLPTTIYHLPTTNYHLPTTNFLREQRTLTSMRRGMRQGLCSTAPTTG